MNWATLPTPSDFLTGITVWADPIFQSFLPIVFFAVGISVAILLVLFLMLVFKGVFGRGHGGSMVSSNTYGHTSGALRSGLAHLDSWTFRKSPQGRRFLADVNN